MMLYGGHGVICAMPMRFGALKHMHPRNWEFRTVEYPHFMQFMQCACTPTPKSLSTVPDK